MVCWEYRTISVKPYMHEGPSVETDAQFNALGDEGWELVAFSSPAFATFKRRL